MYQEVLGTLGRVTNCILEVVDVVWTCSGLFPVHTPYIFLLAFCGLIFIDFLPSSLSCCEGENFVV